MPTSSSHRTEALRLLDEGLSPRGVAASLGVGLSTVYRWRGEQPALGVSEDEALRAARPRVMRRLIALAQRGDIRAIKEVLARAGEVGPDPNSQDAQMEEIFARVVEHELSRFTPLQASNWLATWLRIKEHLDKVTDGELPVPSPTDRPLQPPDPLSADPSEWEKRDSHEEIAPEPSQWG